MKKDASRQQHGDRPLEPSGDDKLGFRKLAAELAESIVFYAADTGFVVGVEGEWGTGKSSLLNLVLDEIGKYEDGATVVRFAPWLVGSREALLEALFSELALALDVIESETQDAVEQASDLIGKTAAKLREYARRVSGFSKIARLAEFGGVPWAGAAAALMEKVGDAAADDEPLTPLHELKTEIEQRLLVLPKKIVVIVDDLDRLEPREALEVLRLIRAVADFPSVVYLVCYDRTALSERSPRSLVSSEATSTSER